jgi:hypothetical protein
VLSVQFLIIIKSTVEVTVKASFARKIAHLAETFAEPAEYATIMASVLEAAGAAAPKELASQVCSAVAFCGDSTVQADTARIFLNLLKEGLPLSEAQLLVLILTSNTSLSFCLSQEKLGANTLA